MSEIKRIGETDYALKLFPATKGLNFVSRMQAAGGFTDDIMIDVICSGCALGSVAMDRKKFDTHFRGKYKDIAELFTAILKYNDLFPEEGDESGNEDVSEE